MSRRSKARAAPAEEPQLAPEPPGESCPVCEADAAPAPPAPAAEAAVAEPVKAPRSYPSLYDSTTTTLAAIVIGLAVIASIQAMIYKIARSARTEHAFLTRFVTSLVALVVGAYVADTLIAGPDTALLSDEERTLVLHFIKDTCLMVFAYYFGLKAPVPPAEPPEA